MQPIPISVPIYNGMWSYRKHWGNEITAIEETLHGDRSTVYRFSLCSHTGTYIETCQHKLAINVLLEEFECRDFVRPCKVVCLRPKDSKQPVTLIELRDKLENAKMALEAGDALLICTNWGKRHGKPEYVIRCPFFEDSLTDYLASIKLSLLGVDVPVIDNTSQPYQAVVRLFEANCRLLFIAPLLLDDALIKTGHYTVCAFPLNIKGVCASLCSPVLLQSSEHENWNH